MAEKPSKGLADVAAARTAMSDIDGQAGRLFCRGYDISELAGAAAFEETEDPRVAHLRDMPAELAAASGDDTYYRMSRKMEEVVFAENGLYPNVGFYAATVYHYLRIPADLFTSVFSVSQLAGWTSHVMEQHADNRLIRPDSEYIGDRGLTRTPLDQR
jgi:citrate synthase